MGGRHRGAQGQAKAALRRRPFFRCLAIDSTRRSNLFSRRFQDEIDAQHIERENDLIVCCPSQNSNVQQCLHVPVHCLHVPSRAPRRLTDCDRSSARQSFEQLPSFPCQQLEQKGRRLEADSGRRTLAGLQSPGKIRQRIGQWANIKGTVLIAPPLYIIENRPAPLPRRPRAFPYCRTSTAWSARRRNTSRGTVSSFLSRWASARASQIRGSIIPYALESRRICGFETAGG